MKHLIIGGTGTLGKAIVNHLITDWKQDQRNIYIFSRDEAKQSKLKAIYPNINFQIGDICDKDDLIRASRIQATHVYHCAASKHVDLCETHVNKCIKINYLGTKHVYDLLGKNCNKFWFFTTDKAVAPINAYGYSKALAEKYLQTEGTNFVICRWGNIIGSTGSVIPIFVKSIKEKGVAYLTDNNMSRYWLKIDDAARFAMDCNVSNKVQVPWDFMFKSPLRKMIYAIGNILGQSPTIKITGIRPGEKMHEAMEVNEFGVKDTSDNDFRQVDVGFIESQIYDDVMRCLNNEA